MPLTITGQELLADGQLTEEQLESPSATPSTTLKDTYQWRSFTATKTQVLDEKKRLLKARITTDDTDSYGTVVVPTGARLEAFMLHPSVFYNHNYNLLIGNGLSITTAPHHIDVAWQFIPKGIDQFAESLWKLIQLNFIWGYSIGFTAIMLPPLAWCTQSND